MVQASQRCRVGDICHNDVCGVQLLFVVKMEAEVQVAVNSPN